MTRNTFMIGILCASLAGCQAGNSGGGAAGDGAAAASGADSKSTAAGGDSPATRVVGYLDGRPISHNDLQAALYEAAGGQVLAELILDRRIAKRLADSGATLSDSQVEGEKAALLNNLDPRDPDNAVRLMSELRRRRGLGEDRFAQLLKRNAGMRLIVQNEITITEDQLKQAYDIEYGPRFETRLITVENLGLASEIVRRARGEFPAPGSPAESFIDLAVRHSTDSSRAQGGLLAPVSPADPTWPDGVRKAVAILEEGKVSEPIAIEKGFAILKLEQKLPAKPIQLEAVRTELTSRVRRNAERIAMQRLARTMLNEVELIVADRTLRESWAQQKELMFQE